MKKFLKIFAICFVLFTAVFNYVMAQTTTIKPYRPVYAPSQNKISDAYSENIRNKISANWKPARIRDLQDFVFVAVVSLDKSGNIRSIDVVKSDASKEYEKNAIAIIKKSAPFGPIPYLKNEYKFQCYMDKERNSRTISIRELK